MQSTGQTSTQELSFCPMQGSAITYAMWRANLANGLRELTFRHMAITSRMLRERGKRQAEKLGIDPERVPPGQYLTERFPVLTVGPNPAFDLANWDFTVFGEVENELTLSWEDLQALPQKELKTDIH